MEEKAQPTLIISRNGATWGFQRVPGKEQVSESLHRQRGWWDFAYNAYHFASPQPNICELTAFGKVLGKLLVISQK